MNKSSLKTKFRIVLMALFCTLNAWAQVDVTSSYIVNPAPTATYDGWTVSETPTMRNDLGVAEFWNKSGASLRQTINSLPAGSYKLTAIAFTRTGMTATLFAGSNSMNIATVSNTTVNSFATASTWLDAGNGVNELEFTVPSTSNVTIGLQADDSYSDHWMVWRSFKLEKYDSDLIPLTVEATSGGQVTYGTNAVTDSRTFYLSEGDDAVLTITPNTYYELKSVIKNGTTNISSQVTNGQLTLSNITSATTITVTFGLKDLDWDSANASNPLDITHLVVNPDFEELSANGWTTIYESGAASNVGYQTASYSNGSVTVSHFIEAWRPSTLGDISIEQTLDGLPQGTYLLEADVIASSNASGAYLFLKGTNGENTKAISTENAKPQHYSVSFTKTNSGSLTIGVKTVSTTANWLAADNFQLKYLGSGSDVGEECTVTYNVTFNGKVVATATEQVAKGSALPAVPTSLNNDFVTLTKTGTHPTTVTSDVTVTYAATFTGPFEFSTSLDEAKWYNLTIRSSYYVGKTESEPYSISAVNETTRATDAYQWAFGGDPYHIKIYNRTTGFDQTLTKEGTYAVMRSGDYTWDMLSYSDGFIIRETGTAYNCLNQYGGIGGTLQFWNSSSATTDPGSIFHVEEVPSNNNNEVTNQPLITSVSQLSSPYTETLEGAIGNLIDNDVTTFWHSAWSSGSVTLGTHYLQATMPQGEYSLVVFQFTRRSVPNDHTIEWSVRGTNSASAAKADCEELLHAETPFTSNTETLTSEPFSTKGYKYLRFYSEEQYPSSRGYFHLAEFQIYPVESDVNVESLTITVSEGGLVTYNTSTISNATKTYSINEGTDAVFTITPNSGYELKSVTLNGSTDVTSQVTNGQLTISNITSATTIAVTFGLKDLDWDSASTSNPLDITHLVVNPDFEELNTNGWTANYESGAASNVGYQSSSYSNGSVTISHFIEAWKSSTLGDISIEQTLDGLPQGTYLLEADVIASSNASGAYLFLKGTNGEKTKAVSTESAKPQHFSASFTKTNSGSLTIGVKTVSTTANWLAADNFKLKYLGASDVNEESLTITVSEGGQVTYNTNTISNATKTYSINEGTDAVFTITPNSGYELKSVILNGSTDVTSQVTNGQLTIGNITAATTIAVTFSMSDIVDPTTDYERALAAIQDGASYRISTDVNGTKYYVTEDGKLTSTKTSGGIFTITKVSSGTYQEYGYRIDSGSLRFTNPPLNNNAANLTPGSFATTSNDRADWERQVLFLNTDGKYAVRSCNTAEGTTSWNDAGRTYWTWGIESVPTPQYTYTPTYVWLFELEATIQVTYELYDTDGTTFIDSVTKQQDSYSEINIPAELTSNYAYDYVTTGIIGDTDCTIKVTRTPKSGKVHALSDLSNSKAYTIHCDRGSFITADNHLASTSNSSYATAQPSSFAIINYQNRYYLYSVSDKKFVTNSGTLAEAPNSTDDAVIMEAKTDPYFFFYFSINGSNNGLNTSSGYSYGIVINTWANVDAGNQYYMIEEADFDATEALSQLNATFNGQSAEEYNAEYATYIATYPYNKSSLIPSISTWDGGLSELKGQHWDGTSNSTYYEQTAGQWSQSSWTSSSYTSLTLPAGKYVVMVAGRSAASTNVEAYMQLDNTKVVFPAKGDVGLGVDINGVGTMSSDSTYANNNAGRGWEYRYIAFESDGKTPVKLTLGGAATASYQWMSFTQPVLLAQSANDSPLIQFADATVKAICVANWDADGDGELNEAEAAEITDLGVAFKGDSTITSFDELQYFTGLTKISHNAFDGCSKLTTVTLPHSVTSIGYAAFKNCSSLTSLDFSSLNIDNVTDMNDMFYGCSKLTSLDVSGFNTDNVTDMSGLFRGCSSLTSLDLGGFKTDNVTNMNFMFSGCSNLTSLDVSGFKTENVKNMKAMFGGCSKLTSLNVSGFKTGNVTDMNGMFYSCSSLTSLDVSGFKTDNVTEMESMFNSCSSLKKLDLSDFKTGNVTSMEAMFSGCSSLTSLDLSSFKTDNVTSMRYMFQNCSSLTSLDVSDFKTDNVTDMGHMFYFCSSLMSLNLSGFDTNNVTDMSHMFQGCLSLMSLDVSDFKTDNVTSMGRMFSGCSKLRTIYVGNGWTTEKVTEGYSMFSDCAQLVGGQGTAYNFSHIDHTYAHIDGGTSNPGYFTGVNIELSPYAVLSNNNTVLTFYYDNQKESRGGRSVGPFSSPSDRGWDNQKEAITTVVFDASFANYTSLTSTAYWFHGLSQLTAITGIKNLKTDNVTNMSYMFDGCSSLTSLDVSSFKTDNVTNMNFMFYSCSGLTSLDVSGFKTDNVTKMTCMFYVCSNLTSLDVSGFKTDNVTEMIGMFGGCYSLTSLDVSGFKTDNVKSMSSMFESCTLLTSLDVSGFKTDNVTDMSYMFTQCFGLTTLDLSSFKTGNVTNMKSMFHGCSNLGSIYIGEGWTTTKVTEGYGVFSGCYQLVGSQGTVYDSNHIDDTYAHIDEGTLNPGYLTEVITIASFVTDGMTFKVTSQAMKKVTYVKGPAAEQITVPSEVAYDGNTYSVTAIADSAFAGQSQLKSVKVPSSVKAAGKNLFAGSSHVAAIIWEAPLKMTKEMAGTLTDNPNLLFYTSDTAYAPNGVTNIINSQTKQAERIVLSDGDNNDFYCPEEFTASSISYTHAYQLFTVSGQCQGWESLVLPFDVTEIKHETKGTITPFGALQIGHEFDNGTKPFWLYEYTTGRRFTEADGIRANVPYILSMPNEAKFPDEYILAGNITFKGTNATVKATSGAKAVQSGNLSFTPNYQNGTSETVYLLNVDQSYDGNPKGSIFVRSDLLERQARPLEAYFQLSGSAGVKGYFGVFDQLTDEIRSIEPAKRNSNAEYYQLDGTKRDKLQRGFNIVRTPDGKTQKMLAK